MPRDWGTRVWGNQPLSPKVTIQSGVNDSLTVRIDGVDYTFTIPAGEYETSHELFTSELIGAVNDQLISLGFPFLVRLGGIHDDSPRTILVLEHNELASHTFEGITGTAVSTLIGSIYQIDVYEEPSLPTPTDSTPQDPTPATPTP